MRASTGSTLRRRAVCTSGLVAFTFALAACGDLPSVPATTAPLHEGDVVEASGDAELTVRAAGATRATVRTNAPWRVRANSHGGVATMDFERRGLAARDPARDRDGKADDTEARLLGDLAPTLLGPLAINEDAKLAGFGLKSVVQQTVLDGDGRPMQVYAISDFKHGPMTDMLLVRDGQVLAYQQTSWVHERGVWRAAGARVVTRARDGSSTMATVRVAGRLAAVVSDSSAWATLTTRIEEVQFAALAKRALLPSEAHAQQWSPGSVDCSLYRNRFAPSNSPCLAYGLNKVGAPLIAVFTVLAASFPQYAPSAMQALAASRGIGAVIALLEAAGEAIAVTAGSTWVALAAAGVLIYFTMSIAECMASHGPTITLCSAGPGGNPFGSGVGSSTNGTGGGGSGVSTGLGDGSSSGCDALCDVQARDLVNQLRAQAYANQDQS